MISKLWQNIKKLLGNKKVLLGLATLLVLFLILNRKKPQELLATQKVAKGKIEVTVSASGSVRSETEVKVQFQTSGKLAWLGVKEGDFVKKGQALASLDKENLKKSFEKTMNLYLTNRWDFEQTQDDYRFAKESYLLTDEMKRILDKYQFSLNNAVLDVEIANLAVKYATIYSPIAGIVTKVNPPVAGLNILSTSAYVEIADPDKMEFEAIVDETDIASLAVAQPAILALDAFPEKDFNGEIKRISFKSTTSSSGGTGFAVYLSLPEDQMASLRIGMNGDFKAITQAKDNVLLVPLEAIIEEEDQRFVFRLVKEKAFKTEVQTGLANENLVEITSGLNEGEEIILENISLLKNGQKVN